METETADPFYEAKNEVDISIKKLEELYNSWLHMVDKSSILAKETYILIREEINYLDVDLDDLENSVNIVKRNSSKFKISEEEIHNRTVSINKIRNVLNDVKRKMKEHDTLSNKKKLKGDYNVNNTALKRQDKELEELAESAERLHNVAVTINTELKDQQLLLEELENEMEYSNEKMNIVTKKIAEYLKTNNPKTLSLIFYLAMIAFFLTVVLIVT